MAITPRLLLAGPALDPLPIWIALKILSATAIVVCVIGIALELFELILPATFDSWPILLAVWSYLAYGQWIAAFGCVAVLWLTYRLARNLHALAPNKLSMSPTYAVAMFIVPVVSLFMPPIVVESIERETQVAAGKEIKKRSVAGWWWIAVLVSSVVTGAAQSLMANSGAFDPTAMFNGRAYEVALVADVCGDTLAIVAWLLALRLFGPIVSLQSDLVRAAGSPA